VAVEVGAGVAVVGVGVFWLHMSTIWETETAGQPFVAVNAHPESPEAMFIVPAALQQAWDGVMATKVGQLVTSPQTESNAGVTASQTDAISEHLSL